MENKNYPQPIPKYLIGECVVYEDKNGPRNVVAMKKVVEAYLEPGFGWQYHLEGVYEPVPERDIIASVNKISMPTHIEKVAMYGTYLWVVLMIFLSVNLIIEILQAIF